MSLEGVFNEGFMTTSYDSVVNWAKTGSLWPMTFGRLVDSASWCDRVRARRGSHPLWRPFPGNLGPVRR